ncbi:DgyrCDS12095 [Dimorphilus gyrociliatus]|uniref:histone acetyltransferase n=1 Tax=Dimorphilus gyrociliatus TaxID=2664684 RepID=A0A7I8W5G2_9ANNE|nr:DgyrCDS12095 [Dimorphilus gyrociliatus]
MVKDIMPEVKANPSQILLDAVRKIRGQKQRPNFDRLSHAVRLQKWSTEVLTEYINKAVEDGIILRMYDNKGLMTYKDPQTVSKLKTRDLHVGAASDLTKVLIRTLKELGDPADIDQVEKHIRTGYHLTMAFKADLRQSIESALDKGVKSSKFLYKDGKYSPIDDHDKAVADMASFNQTGAAPAKTTCTTCLTGSGKEQALLSCFDCGESWHPSCLRIGADLAKKIKTMRWQCRQCKTCSACGKRCDSNLKVSENTENPKIVLCLQCDRGFHAECSKKSKDENWICPLCLSAPKLKARKRKRSNSEKRTRTSSGDFNGQASKRSLKDKYPTLHSYTTKTDKSPGTLQNFPSSVLSSSESKATGDNHTKNLFDGLSNFFTPSGSRRMSNSCPRAPVEGNNTRNNNENETVVKEPTDRYKKLKSVRKMNSHTEFRNSVLKKFKRKSENRQSLKNRTNKLLERVKQAEAKLTPSTSGSDTDTDVLSIRSSSPLIIAQNVTPHVSAQDVELFQQAREKALESLATCIENPLTADRFPAAIAFGRYHIDTWYSSPYPEEYAKLARLYICEFCLKYMKSEKMIERHRSKCCLWSPPANQIWRSADLSMWEVDGSKQRIYCQNLCLLAKLFLDHKTLYFDVEPFVFYVLTKRDLHGDHLVGYFSKEKHSSQKYNLSCIMVMPQHQRKGFGRFLIEFSYLLSRKEGRTGTPEKPLSDLGRVSYEAYWKNVILLFLHERRKQRLIQTISIEDISRYTGMCPHDIVHTLNRIGFLKISDRRVSLSVDWSIVSDQVEKDKSNLTRISLDEEKLKWSPPTSSPGEDKDLTEIQKPKSKLRMENHKLRKTSTSNEVNDISMVKEMGRGRGRPRKIQQVLNKYFSPIPDEAPVTESPTESITHNSPHQSPLADHSPVSNNSMMRKINRIGRTKKKVSPVSKSHDEVRNETNEKRDSPPPPPVLTPEESDEISPTSPAPNSTSSTGSDADDECDISSSSSSTTSTENNSGSDSSGECEIDNDGTSSHIAGIVAGEKNDGFLVEENLNGNIEENKDLEAVSLNDIATQITSPKSVSSSSSDSSSSSSTSSSSSSSADSSTENSCIEAENESILFERPNHDPDLEDEVKIDKVTMDLTKDNQMHEHHEISENPVNLPIEQNITQIQNHSEAVRLEQENESMMFDLIDTPMTQPEEQPSMRQPFSDCAQTSYMASPASNYIPSSPGSTHSAAYNTPNNYIHSPSYMPNPSPNSTGQYSQSGAAAGAARNGSNTSPPEQMYNMASPSPTTLPQASPNATYMLPPQMLNNSMMRVDQTTVSVLSQKYNAPVQSQPYLGRGDYSLAKLHELANGTPPVMHNGLTGHEHGLSPGKHPLYHPGGAQMYSATNNSCSSRVFGGNPNVSLQPPGGTNMIAGYFNAPPQMNGVRAHMQQMPPPMHHGGWMPSSHNTAYGMMGMMQQSTNASQQWNQQSYMTQFNMTARR